MKAVSLLILITFSFCSKSQIIDTTSNLSDQDKIFGLSKFWAEAANNFVYFDKAKINWDSTYAAFIPKVLATKNTWSYYQVLKQFASLLQDGHTDIQEPRVLYKSSRYKFSNIEYINKHFYITNIDKNDAAKVPLGSEVLMVNGIPVTDYLRETIIPYLSASTEHQLWNDAARFMFYGTDTAQQWRLTLRTPTGKTIDYNAHFHTYPRVWVVPDAEWKRTIFRQIGDIGYFQINTFGDGKVIDDFKEVLPQLKTSKGVILDIRYNGGGNSEIGAEILKYFTEDKMLIGSTWKTRENLSAFKAWGSFLKDKNPGSLSDFSKKSLLVYQGNYWYQGDTMKLANNVSEAKISAPLVVLMGNKTASAAEDFLIILSMLKDRATTVGQLSFGSTGQPLMFDLPGGGSARICTKRDTYPDGREFVGYGINPDIVVEKNIIDVLKGRDVELEIALEEIKKKIK
jgi:carboxyl-terminal processing protease